MFKRPNRTSLSLIKLLLVHSIAESYLSTKIIDEKLQRICLRKIVVLELSSFFLNKNWSNQSCTSKILMKLMKINPFLSMYEDNFKKPAIVVTIKQNKPDSNTK